MKVKKILHTLPGRLLITCAALALQVLYSLYFPGVYSRTLYFTLTLLSFLAVICIIHGRSIHADPAHGFGEAQKVPESAPQHLLRGSAALCAAS